jgi:ornithine cyclodeaminase/alanine dehydrogenase-like protein (mu-crystallin family)
MLIVSRSDAEGLLQLTECVAAVEEAFAERGQGQGLSAKRFHLAAGDGAFHVTAGGIANHHGAAVFGIKMNGRFPPASPGGGQRVSGSIILADGESGRPIALLDSLLVTTVRTAAVTAIAVRHLARADAHIGLIIGAGKQAAMQVDALQLACRMDRLLVHDIIGEHAERMTMKARSQGLQAEVARDVNTAALEADVIVTVTPSTAPFLNEIPEGVLVVALGADAPGKRELGPNVLSTADLVIVDVREQAAYAGELAGAIADGSMTIDGVYAELGEVVAKTVSGRTNDRQRIVFDATGTALQDVAASLLIVEAARKQNRGTTIDLDG